MPRSTIHFYISEGLLPRPAKTAASRSLYSQNHFELLRRITGLKESGMSLAEIRDELAPELVRSSEAEIDLAAREYERVHADLIEAATEEFVARGYEDTHVATIVKRVHTTPHVFYGHFDSKLHLLAECFKEITGSSIQSVESKLETTHDLAERLLTRLSSDPARHVLRAEAVSLIRTTADSAGDAAEALIETYAQVVAHVEADIRAMHPEGAPSPGVPIELLAYSMVGAFDNTLLRASWDDRYGRADLFRAHLWLYFAVRAAVDGRADIDSEVERYEQLIQQAAASEQWPAGVVEAGR